VRAIVRKLVFIVKDEFWRLNRFAYVGAADVLATKATGLFNAAIRLDAEPLRDVHGDVYCEQRTRLRDADLKSRNRKIPRQSRAPFETISAESIADILREQAMQNQFKIYIARIETAYMARTQGSVAIS
jgi:hypothetical protein